MLHSNCCRSHWQTVHDFLYKLELPGAAALPTYETLLGWEHAPQTEMGVQTVEVAKVAGTSSHVAGDYDPHWIPRQPDSRLKRILFGALLAADKQRFLDACGYKHVFHVPARDEYHVCMDGNRRTCVAHLLKVKYLTYSVTRLDVK